MKKIILSSLFLAGVMMAQGQAVTESVFIKDASQNAQENWYNLESGSVGTALTESWDIAFQADGLTNAGVRINSRKGVELYLYNGSWATLDTAGMTMTALNNSPYTWNDGAANSVKDVSNAFDYGWGSYMPQAHQVQGNKVYVLKLNDSTYMKFKIDSLAGSGSSEYFFTLANLDGTNEAQYSVNKTAYPDQNYIYYNVANNTFLNNEPTTLPGWDLLFTKYADSAANPMDPTQVIMHLSSGVLSNPTVQVAQVDNVSDSSTFVDWWNQTYSTDINAIGYDWKTFNMTSYTYEYAQGRVYFVKSNAGNIWKLIFLGYNSQTGEIQFSKEMISTAGLNTLTKDAANVVVYPNPASTTVSLILDNEDASSVNVTIQNMQGQVVYQNQLSGKNNFEVKNISVAGLESGVYFVNVETAQNKITKKLVIK